jgi:SNF2 family DNA or RNA helicase
VSILASHPLHTSLPKFGICSPTVALMQWKHEIESHAEDLKVLVWHGSNRNTNTSEISKYDVVLSTYSVLESCFRKQQYGFKRKGQVVKELSPLHKIQWNRAIVSSVTLCKQVRTKHIPLNSLMKPTISRNVPPVPRRPLLN